MSYKIAAVQMTSTADMADNLVQAERLLAEAVALGAKFVSLPECFSLLTTADEMRDRAAEAYEQTSVFLYDVARRYEVTVLGGSTMAPSEAGRAVNKSILSGPEGLIAEYDKIHMFDATLPDRVYLESEFINAGDEVVTAPLPGIEAVLGMTVCYDVRFPELYRLLAAKGASIFSVPAAFTRPTGEAHWELLLRARAVENTAYVIAPAQCGTHYEGRRTHGHSMIVDPWGEILGELEEEPGVVLAEVSLERLNFIRESLPSLKHRKLI